MSTQHVCLHVFFLSPKMQTNVVNIANFFSNWLPTVSRCGVKCDNKLAAEISDTVWKFQRGWQGNCELWVD